MGTKQVEIKKIESKGQSVRNEKDDDHVRELAANIQSVGLLQAIVVEKNGEKFKLIAGFHRLMACKQLGFKQIEANVIKIGEASSVISLAATENILRKQMTLEEECDAVCMLNTKEKRSPGEICVIFSKSRAWVDRRLMAKGLPEPVRKRLFDGDIKIGVAELVGGIQEESIRNEALWQAHIQKLTVSQVRDLIKIYEDAPSIQTAIEAGEKEIAKVFQKATPVRKCDACTEEKEYGELVNIWVCAGGCEKAEVEEVV